jgi:uroporphyrinogen-III decarboxylase
LIGPEQIREFVQPYFRPIWELVSSRGTTIFSMDTDGHIDSVLDALLECGINEVYPMEPAAGMDVVKVRQKYGRRLRFKGGLDKFVLAKGQAAIRRELEYKLTDPGLRAGGIVFGLDHRIPTGTPLAAYRDYIAIGRELLGLPPRDPQARGWARMAF